MKIGIIGSELVDSTAANALVMRVVGHKLSALRKSAETIKIAIEELNKRKIYPYPSYHFMCSN